MQIATSILPIFQCLKQWNTESWVSLYVIYTCSWIRWSGLRSGLSSDYHLLSKTSVDRDTDLNLSFILGYIDLRNINSDFWICKYNVAWKILANRDIHQQLNLVQWSLCRLGSHLLMIATYVVHAPRGKTIHTHHTCTPLKQPPLH
jgi:hypothetical protein